MNWKDGIVTPPVLYDIAQLKGVGRRRPVACRSRGLTSKRGRRIRCEGRSGRRGAALHRPLEAASAGGRGRARCPGYYADTTPVDARADAAFLGHDFNIDGIPRPGWGRHAQSDPWRRSTGWASTSSNASTWSRPRRWREAEPVRVHDHFRPLPVEGGRGSPLNPLAIF